MMIENCPVCKRSLNGSGECVCGYDVLSDFALYRTLSPLSQQDKFNRRMLHKVARLEERVAELCAMPITAEPKEPVKAVEPVSDTANHKTYDLADVSVGGTVTLGQYGSIRNPEPIEWTVLSKNGDTALLISKYAIDCRPYHSKYVDTDWAHSTLREWLNTDFYRRAFSSDEKSHICNGTLHDKNGATTTDQVFLLSPDEVRHYFPRPEDRRVAASKYAKENGAWRDKNGYSWWWLRSTSTLKMAEIVHETGDISEMGKLESNPQLSALRNAAVVTSIMGTVRPAIIIKV